MNALLQIGSIFSTIVQLIHAAELFFPNTPGKEKLNQVVTRAHDIIDEASAQAPGIITDVQSIKDAVVPFVNGVVSVMNAHGIFDKFAAAENVLQTSAPAVIAAVKKTAGDISDVVADIKAKFPIDKSDSASLQKHTEALADAMNTGTINAEQYAAAVNEAHKTFNAQETIPGTGN